VSLRLWQEIQVVLRRGGGELKPLPNAQQKMECSLDIPYPKLPNDLFGFEGSDFPISMGKHFWYSQLALRRPAFGCCASRLLGLFKLLESDDDNTGYWPPLITR